MRISPIKKEVVVAYAPELIEAYDLAWGGDHVDIHEDLFNERMSLRQERYDIFVAGLIEVKEALFPLAEAGEMTYKEVGQAFKAYKEEQRAYFTAITDAAKAEIEILDAANEVNKEIVEGLKAELRAAVEAEDYDTANDIVTELLDYLETHVDYDVAKLVVLEAIEF